MSTTPDPETNLQRAIERIHDAAGRGAQIVCLPELFQTQYFCQREDAALFDLAESIPGPTTARLADVRSEEHTSELQSQSNLVCRLLLEKKKKHYRSLLPLHVSLKSRAAFRLQHTIQWYLHPADLRVSRIAVSLILSSSVRIDCRT